MFFFPQMKEICKHRESGTKTCSLLYGNLSSACRTGNCSVFKAIAEKIKIRVDLQVLVAMYTHNIKALKDFARETFDAATDSEKNLEDAKVSLEKHMEEHWNET